MATDIKFATAGFRGTIAESVTAQNIYRIALGISEHIFNDKYYGFEGEGYQKHIKERGFKFKRPLVLVGNDTRFLSRKFADIVCDTFATQGISVKRAKYPLPTPVAEWAVLKLGAVGAVVITASEADFTQNGLKWISYHGGIANNEVVADIEKNIPAVSNLSKELPEFGYQNTAVTEENFRNKIMFLTSTINIETFTGEKDSFFGEGDVLNPDGLYLDLNN